MANCTGCGRELPAFSVGRLSTLCRECQATENSSPVVPSIVSSGTKSSAISLTSILVGTNVAIFLLMGLSGVSLISPTSAQLVKWGANWGPLSLGTQPWRLLTSNYIHIGVIHIAFNMWCLFQLGALAARIFDRWTYFLIYTATGIAGSIASVWWHPAAVGAGASGAIFGLAGAVLAALYLGKLPIPKAAVRATMKSLLIFAAYNLFLGLRSGVDNAAHVGGLASGLALGAFFSKHLTGSTEFLRQWRSRALMLSVLLLAGSTYYVRYQHTELTGLANPSGYLDQHEIAIKAFRRKDYAEAAAACQKVVQLNPKSAEDRFLLGVAYEGLQRPDDAILQFQEAARLNPKYAEAQVGLAEAYATKGMERESKEASQRAVELKAAR